MTGAQTLHGRTALVTGGAAGIGRACAERLARAGALVTEMTSWLVVGSRPRSASDLASTGFFLASMIPLKVG